MPASTMRPVEGGIPKVIGMMSATPIAAERPGSAPMMIPIVVLNSIASRLSGISALTNPAPINEKSIKYLPLFRSADPAEAEHAKTLKIRRKSKREIRRSL